MPKTTVLWTNELVNECIRLLDEGKSTRQVGKELNMTGNAIIGKMHRLGVKISEHNGLTSKLNKTHRQRPRLKLICTDTVKPLPSVNVEEPKVKQLPVPKIHLKSKSPPIPLPELAKPVLTGCACTILELTKRCCHWPMWEQENEPKLYCGEPVEGKNVYCAIHHKLSLRVYVRPVSGFRYKKLPGKLAKIDALMVD